MYLHIDTQYTRFVNKLELMILIYNPNSAYIVHDHELAHGKGFFVFFLSYKIIDNYYIPTTTSLYATVMTKVEVCAAIYKSGNVYIYNFTFIHNIHRYIILG